MSVQLHHQIRFFVGLCQGGTTYLKLYMVIYNNNTGMQIIVYGTEIEMPSINLECLIIH